MTIDDIDLNNLLIFYKTAKIKNLEKAANFFNLNGTNISRRIKQLEEEVSLTLVDRSVKAFKLTIEGAELLRYIEPYMIEMQRLNQFSVEKNSVVVGIDRIYGEAYFRKHYDFLVTHFAPKKVECISDEIENLDKLLINEAVDFVISNNFMSKYKGCKKAKLDQTNLAIMVNIAVRDRGELSELLFLEYDTKTFRDMNSFEEETVERQHYFKINDYEIILDMVNENLGYAILPRILLTRRHNNVHFFPLENDLNFIQLTYRIENPLSDLIQKLARALRAEVSI